MFRFIVLALILTCSTLNADEPTLVGAVSLDRSEQYLFPSKAVGDSFRIDVVLPILYSESETRYPVVYVTDSNYLLTSAAATQLAQATEHLPAVILVGIGYDVPSIADTSQIRVRDFSPTCDEAYIKRSSLPDHLCGGADSFIEFIEEELKPFINGKYRTKDDATLVGFSFGGLFALHALFERNDVFDRYIIGSPSIEWDEEVLFREEAEYAKHNDDLDKVVYLSVGGLEGYGTIPRVYEMYELLLSRKYPGLRVKVELLEDETHMTAINATVMRGLRSVLYSDPKYSSAK
ncbi:MAG: alpha/beta hydrolase [Gammaproteobacteria bacterium]|jgi:uncharacterized protein|nr:alpha/beta hydrolase [Gammaproteobacteria bacterium]MBT4491720.1 alpha/beta hydrolase [Gammaproteobacteria bacterium]